MDRCERPILRNVGRRPSRRHSSAIKAWKNSKLGTRDDHMQRYILQLEQNKKAHVRAPEDCPIIPVV